MRGHIIRTDNWKLKATIGQKTMVEETLRLYRAYAQALIPVIWVNMPLITKLTDPNLPEHIRKSKCAVIESLIHQTKDNPNPKYSYFGKKFYKFPSYLRRGVIEDAYGQVTSFITRYDQWLDEPYQAKKETKTASESKTDVMVEQPTRRKPPRRTAANNLNPSLYRGQCCKFNEDYSFVELKLFNSKDWVWETFEVTKRGHRHLRENYKELSPQLIYSGGKVCLGMPYDSKQPKLSKMTELACSVDLGMNTSATAAIIDNTGTVIDRKFFHLGVDIDRRDKGLGEIRQKAKKTQNLYKGFCAALYRKVSNRNKEIACKLAKMILDYAIAQGAQVLVFEDLKFFRPRGGRKRSNLRQRFHGWLHRLLVKRVEMKAQEVGIRTWFVYARGTSRFAFDGSGKVKRDKENYALATFSNGKRYNADLNAAYNIGARFWVSYLKWLDKIKSQETGAEKIASEDTGKSSGSSIRTSVITLSTLWQLNAQRCGA